MSHREPPEIAALRAAIQAAFAESPGVEAQKRALLEAGWQLELHLAISFLEPGKLSAEPTDDDRRWAGEQGIDL